MQHCVYISRVQSAAKDQTWHFQVTSVVKKQLGCSGPAGVYPRPYMKAGWSSCISDKIANSLFLSFFLCPRVSSTCLNLDTAPLSSTCATKMAARGAAPTPPSSTTKTTPSWKITPSAEADCLWTTPSHRTTNLWATCLIWAAGVKPKWSGFVQL